MVRIFLLLTLTLKLATTLQAKEPFTQHCMQCHSQLNIGFEKFYMQYLIKFSSADTIKEAMFYYLRDPKKEQSVMPKHIIKELGVMPKVAIIDKELREMIEVYIKRFDLRRKLH